MSAAALLLGLTFALPTSDSLFQRAESLLAAGSLAPARVIAARLLARDPRDVRALILMGRIYLAWPVFGRYHADSLLTRAARLDPSNPEPLYWLGHVGLALGGDDGELIARPALVKLFAMNPNYRDVWELWLRLYRGDKERRAAVHALALHDGNAVADQRRAVLLVELRRHDSAATLLERLIARRPRDPSPRAILARALYEAGRDEEAARAYEAALRLAHHDTANTLWLQVRAIASPAERERYDALSRDHREAFFRRFWLARDPDLLTAANERIGEHFRRYAEARRGFALLHPNARYHRSRAWRAAAGGLGTPPGPEMGQLITRALGVTCTGGTRSIRDEAVARGAGPPLRTPPGEETPNLEDQLDDRGRIWVRYGRPEERHVFGLDGETWCYRTQAGLLRVTFMRRTGGWGASGDLVVTPVVSSEAAAAEYLLATDRPSIDTPSLTFAFWPASFRRRMGTLTELVLFPDSVAAVAVMIDDDGLAVARDSATAGPLRLVAPPGRYLLLMDGARGGSIGRYRGSVALPSYPGGELGVSGLLIAAGDVPARRDSLERAAPAGLKLAANAPLRLYAEVYGLAARDGAVSYEATYRFERVERTLLGLSRRRRITTIALHRELPAAESHVESLRIDPGRLPRGQYRVQLEVSDPIRGTRVVSASLEFDLR
jgi:tetratricopeptide (TPR) repeat protein